ncbi:MAG: SCO family protein [Thermosynechococcaceae cyanobacterium]
MVSKTRLWWISSLIIGVLITFIGIGSPALAQLEEAIPLVVSTSQALPELWAVPDFTLTDQTQHQLQRQDLRGQVWVASFIYTSCPDVCPLITRQIAALRDALVASALLGDSVRLVSFTVDPERDSPAVLQTYAQKFKAENPQDWAFLTGDRDQIRTLLVDGFHLIVEPNAQMVMGDNDSAQQTTATGDIAHSNRAMVVDRCGQVRASHPVLEPDRFKQLVKDLTAVVQEPGTC